MRTGNKKTDPVQRAINNKEGWIRRYREKIDSLGRKREEYGKDIELQIAKYRKRISEIEIVRDALKSGALKP